MKCVIMSSLCCIMRIQYYSSWCRGYLQNQAFNFHWIIATQSLWTCFTIFPVQCFRWVGAFVGDKIRFYQFNCYVKDYSSNCILHHGTNCCSVLNKPNNKRKQPAPPQAPHHHCPSMVLWAGFLDLNRWNDSRFCLKYQTHNKMLSVISQNYIFSEIKS